MPFERSADRRVARISLAALLSLAPAVARAAEPAAGPAAQSGQAVQPGRAKGEEIDAEVLRDLDVLDNPNYARDREVAKRLSFYERTAAAGRSPRSCRAGQKGGEVTC